MSKLIRKIFCLAVILLSVLKTIRYAYGSGKLLAISSKTSFDIIVLVRQPY